jgi:hypothetical protein
MPIYKKDNETEIDPDKIPVLPNVPAGKILKDDGIWIDIPGSTPDPNSHAPHSDDQDLSALQSHCQSAHAPLNAQKNSDITKAEIEAKLIGEISTHTHAWGAGGNGYCIQGSAANQATTTDGQTLYWGNIPLAPTTTAGNTRIYIPKAGTIKAAYVFVHSATAGSAENWSMNIRKNNSADTLIQTLLLASAQRVWSKTDLNLAVALGDYIEIKEVCPAWATNPANVRRSFIIYIE